MATAKTRQTVHIVNPKDPSDPKPWIANVDDVARKGFTLWADRHDPKRALDKEVAERKEPEVADLHTEDKPLEQRADDEASTAAENKEDEAPVAAVNPKDIRKSPGNKKG